MTQTIAQELGRIGGVATATHFGAKLASRAIPGVGEVLLAYDGVSIGYEMMTGKSWGDTYVGGAVNAATDKAANVALSGASGLLSAVGMKDAAKFVDTTGRWALTGSDGSDALKIDAEKSSGAPQWRSGPFRTTAAEDLPPATASLQSPPLDPTKLRETAFAPAAGPGLNLRQAAASTPSASTIVNPAEIDRDHAKIGLIAASSDPAATRSRIVELTNNFQPAPVVATSQRKEGLSL